MTDRDKLIELIINADTHDSSECKLCTKDDDACDCCYAEKLADYLLANGVICPPCKVGDYVLWNNGLKDSENRLYEVKGFYYDSNDFGLRYILEFGQPIINHSGIVGILTKEEAEAELKELGK